MPAISLMNNDLAPAHTKYMWRVSAVVAFGGFLFGFDTAIISGVLKLVKTQFLLNAFMEGWFVSAALVGCITGVSFSGYLSDRFGRKQLLLVSAGLFIISSAGCMFAPSIEILIFFRFVCGLGIGITSVLAPMYISEFAPADVRGRLVSFYQLAITIGIVCAYFSNSYLIGFHHDTPGQDFFNEVVVRETWRAMLGINLVPASIFCILLFFIPQTPRWLIKKMRTDEAFEILRKINGHAAGAQELFAIRENYKTVGKDLKVLLQPGYRKALFIGILLPFLGQFSGINAIIYYGPKIFNQAGVTLSNSLDGQLTIGIVNVLSTLLAIRYVDKLGRRPLLIYGTTGIIISLITTSVLFHLHHTSGAAITITLLFFSFCYAFSLGPVQWVIMSEIYPNQIRGRAMAVATMSLWIAATIIAQIFPRMLAIFHETGVFLFFACCSVGTILLTIFLIPETKNKSLEEIESFWK